MNEWVSQKHMRFTQFTYASLTLIPLLQPVRRAEVAQVQAQAGSVLR